MRNLLLSVALIAAPVGLFTVAYPLVTPPPAAEAANASGPSLGDLGAFEAIVGDVQSIAGTGDLAAAQVRITDFETAWDEAEAALRPVNPEAWGNVDAATDEALRALRAGSPDAAVVKETLAALQAELADPSRPAGGASTPGSVAGIATTDANGHPLPCEAMLETLRSHLAGATLSDADRQAAVSLQSKGTERCNADDDARADAFFAQGIALTAQ